MNFGGFKIGKSKEKRDSQVPANVTQITELEEQLNSQTDNLKQTEQKLKKLSSKIGITEENTVTRVLPHGPISELSVEPEEKRAGPALTTGENKDTAPEESAEEIKLVEIKAKSAAPPPVETEARAEDFGGSLNKLYHSEEEEENPLSNLIRSLPEVTTDELMADLKEIQNIIKDLQKK